MSHDEHFDDREPISVQEGPLRSYGFRPPCRHATIPVFVSAAYDGLWTWSPVACRDADCDLVFTIRERPRRTYVDYWIIHPASEA